MHVALIMIWKIIIMQMPTFTQRLLPFEIWHFNVFRKDFLMKFMTWKKAYWIDSLYFVNDTICNYYTSLWRSIKVTSEEARGRKKNGKKTGGRLKDMGSEMLPLSVHLTTLSFTLYSMFTSPNFRTTDERTRGSQ